LDRVGLDLRWQEDLSRSHAATDEALTESLAADALDIDAELGDEAFDELLRASRLWIDWIRCGRVRKIALVAENGGPGALSLQLKSCR
jgi:hypothetical protein